MRTVLTATVVASLVVLFLCTSNSNIATSIRTMASSNPQQDSPTDPHISQTHLTLELTEKTPPTDPPTLIATLTNQHPSTTLTLLKWETPFDSNPLLYSLFHFTDTETGALVPSLGLKINRVMPPPADAFLEIAPRHAVATEIVVKGPGVAELRRGRSYEVQVRGVWKAVWHASVSEVGYANLQKMGGGTGVVGLEFASNVVRVEM